MKKTWLITGCDKGMGYVFAQTLLDMGERVVITARDVGKVSALLEQYRESAFVYSLDVTKSENISHVVESAERVTGGIDVLVNNAGYGLLGAIEATVPSEYRSMFEVNFFGAAEVTRAALPFMRERRRGYIINISSIGGFAASPAFGFYAASKFALEGFSESLAQEISAFGIKVTILEPGSTRTDFAGASMARTAMHIEDYENTSVKNTLERMDGRHGVQPGNPARIAKVLFKFSRLETPPLRFPTGDDGVARMRSKLSATTADLERYEALALATSFDSQIDLNV